MAGGLVDLAGLGHKMKARELEVDMGLKIVLIACVIVVVAAAIIFAVSVFAQNAKSIKLLSPQMQNSKTLKEALQERKSGREFSPRDLSLQELSDLLWAACGVNRQDSGLRTAPSAMNLQEIDIYLAKKDGLFLYDAKKNILKLVLPKDLRGLTGKQPFVSEAPIDFIYVADFDRMTKLASEEDKKLYSGTDTGFISQNVYLYCASAGLTTVVRGSLDREVLAKAMNLRPQQKIILAQTVGYPK